MELASYPKLPLRNALPTTLRSSEPVPGNQTSPFTWQGNNSDTPSAFFLQQGSVGGTNFPGPSRHPPMECYNEAVDSARSLLSSQTWGSRNNTTPPSVELNNLLNFNGTTLMTHLAAPPSHVAAIHQLPNNPWCLKGIDSGNCSPEVVPDLGLSQISLPLRLPGELGVSRGRRHYMDLEQSRACESPHWSLWSSSLLSCMKQYQVAQRWEEKLCLLGSITRLVLVLNLVSFDLQARWVSFFGLWNLHSSFCLFVNFLALFHFVDLSGIIVVLVYLNLWTSWVAFYFYFVKLLDMDHLV